MVSSLEFKKLSASKAKRAGLLRRSVIKITGRVQGVGFRPFVFRMAKKYGIKGLAFNEPSGITIDAEGQTRNLKNFINSINSEKPPLALIDSISCRAENPVFYNDFNIKESLKTEKTAERTGKLDLKISPDIATCDKCLKELFDPTDRRYLYPFINCTDCGPRFTIITGLPYDRRRTSMKKFKMCPDCLKEYKNPLERRFHAEPDSCFSCGPRMEFIPNKNFNATENKIITGKKAIEHAVKFLEEGRIVAVKGIGGFHLVCDAASDEAVKLLRERKKRPSKPFAVMFGDIRGVSKYAFPPKPIAGILNGRERPILLLEGRGKLSWYVNCGLRDIGIFLPYAPLHHIILSIFKKPLVATSANIQGEPIIKENKESFLKLKNIADAFLVHDRDIIRRCDDSVIKPSKKGLIFIRRSRGYAPDPVRVGLEFKRSVLAAGSYLKNTFAFGFPGNTASTGMENRSSAPFPSNVLLSQHNGDLDSQESLDNFKETVADFERLYNFNPEVIICDSHPDYENTKWAIKEAEKRGIRCVTLQHHRAHVISCMAENAIPPGMEVLGVAFDGSGGGDDESVWGGEFFKGGYENLARVASLKPFRLLGGEKATKSPSRILLSLLFELYPIKYNTMTGNFTDGKILDKYLSLTGFTPSEIKILFKMWENGVNSPYASSCGRLFDAVSRLCGFTGNISYEGEAAIYLEDLARGAGAGDVKRFEYEINFDPIKNIYVVDYLPMIRRISEIISDTCHFDPKAVSKRFIKTLSSMILDVSKIINCKNVCLGGGVFQNSILLENTYDILKKSGFKPFFNKMVPPNDGGLSLGQAVYGGLIE